jgi:urea transporter
LFTVVLTNFLAYIIGFNRENIKAGFYGFNSLLVALGLGIYYQLNSEFIFVLCLASVLTLFLTLLFEGVVGKYGLPFLSLSFLVSIWIMTLATRQFSNLQLSERGIFMLNEMHLLGGIPFTKAYLWMSGLRCIPR